MKNLITLLLYIWQLPQNIVGLILRIFYKADSKVPYKGKIIRVCKKFPGGISLGETIFVSKYPNNQYSWNTVKHEYGHSIQSKWLGPLYLLIIGIPSGLWCLTYKAFGKDYYWFYTEKWADKLGGVKR